MQIDEIQIRVTNARKKSRLEWYEEEIKRCGRALASILTQLRDDSDKPYLLNHETWEAYCQERWNMSPRRTQQLVASENVRLLLADEAPDMAEEIKAMPEGQMRVLVTTPPSKRVEVLKAAKTIPGKFTANTIKQAKARIIPSDKPIPEVKLCSHCGAVMK